MSTRAQSLMSLWILLTTLALGTFVDSLSEAVELQRKAAAVNYWLTLDKRSAVEVDGLRLSIQALEWHDRSLQVTIHSEFVSQDGAYPVRPWSFERPWYNLYVRFWDLKSNHLSDDVLVFVHHSDFLFDKVQWERQTFRVVPPRNARFLSVGYTMERFTTKRVYILPAVKSDN